MQDIIILGNGITAELMFAFINDDYRYKIKGFCVERDFITSDKFLDIDIIALEDIERFYDRKTYKVLMAVGYSNLNKIREELCYKVKSLGYEFLTYIHKDAKVYSGNIGEGSVILSGTVFEPYATIGKNSVIWSNCVIAHNVEIEDNCWIAAGSVISANAVIKRNSFIGVNSTITNRVVVEEYNIIGAGALITKNTKKEDVYLAKQAEKIRFSSSDYIKLTKI
jgi:sugar O-acyltransferase (sialic acid O-acetyltransferase NeuD family)